MTEKLMVDKPTVDKPTIIRIRVENDSCEGCIASENAMLCKSLPDCFIYLEEENWSVEHHFIFKYKEGK